jgi:diguanylate cyclase (GGDEF)-like protein
MSAEQPTEDPKATFTGGSQHWRAWLICFFVFGLFGLAAAVYLWVLKFRSGSSSLLDLLPALIFGFFSIVLLLNFFVARAEAVIEALREQVTTQKIEAELNRELSLMDPVTEVYNRRYARIILQREAKRVARYGTTMALMMVDITGFRRVNESLGQTGGDVALHQIAHLLQNTVRNSDMIVRFGGDEFLLILPEAQKEGIELLAGRLRKSLIDWAPTAGLGDFGLRFAIGIAYYNADSKLDQVVSTAEERMLRDRSPSTAATPARVPMHSI